MATVKTLPPEITAEVEIFSADRGIDRYLPVVLDLTQASFPDAPVSVSVGQDAEDMNHRYVALDVAVDGWDADQILAGQRAWSRGLLEVCPPALAVYFVLDWK